MALLRGLTAPITEEGYQRVVDMKSDAEMLSFIRRAAATLPRKVIDEGQLSGFTPYYSGTTSAQTLARLLDELREKPFLEDGDALEITAPLTEAGYQLVAALRSDAAMAHFVRRVAAAEVRRVTNEDDLNGFAPFYSGTQSVQSLEAMRREIRGAQWAEVANLPECAAWAEGAMGARFPHAFSLVPSDSEPGKHKLRLACAPGEGSSLVAIHFAVNPADPSAACPLNFENGRACEGSGAATFVVETPEGPGYPDIKQGSVVSYWLGVIQGPIVEMPEGGAHGGVRYSWTARVY